MKNKYNLRVEMHKFSEIVEVYADDVQIEEGSYRFVKDMGSHWKPIAFYPIQYTIIRTIEEIKK